MERIYLDVPYVAKDEAKALGARWDPTARRWFVPAGVDAGPFARWIEPELPVFRGPKLVVQIVWMPDHCWKCAESIRPIVGVQMPVTTDDHPDGWVEIDFASAAIAATLGAEQLAQQGIGPIEWRRTKIVPEGYWANTCQHCTATIGSFPLREALMDAMAEGIARDQLPWFPARLPVDGLSTA